MNRALSFFAGVLDMEASMSSVLFTLFLANWTLHASLTALAINKSKTRTMSRMLQFRGGAAQFVSFGAITVGAVKPSAPPCLAKPVRAGHCHDRPFSQCAFIPSIFDNGRTRS